MAGFHSIRQTEMGVVDWLRVQEFHAVFFQIDYGILSIMKKVK